MFVKHIIQTLNDSVTIICPSLGVRLSCLVLLLPSLLVCVVVTSTSGTHTHRQHYSHIPNKWCKQAEKVVTALSTKDDPLKMVK